MNSVRSFVGSNRDSIIITLFGLSISFIGPLFIDAFKGNDLHPLVFGLFIVTVIPLFIINHLNQKYIIEKWLDSHTQSLVEHFGFDFKIDQFFERKRHYGLEKKKLARALVKEILPKFIDNIINEKKEENISIDTINIIIDSGTTLISVFSDLLLYGIENHIKNKNVNINIHTNNIAGIEEIHKLSHRKELSINEKSINIIGGNPIIKHRSTIGDETKNFLETIYECDENVVNISILSANCFIAGNDLKSLALCVRDGDQKEFKKLLSDKSHYRIVISPLGKIFQIEDLVALEKLLGEPFNTVKLEMPKESTFLFTSKRPELQKYALHEHYKHIKLASEADGCKYTLLERAPIYKPKGKSRKEIMEREMPFNHLRKEINEFYRI